MSRRTDGVTLELKVPLLITGLLAAVLALCVMLSYNEVRSSTLAAAHERLQRVTTQLADAAHGSAAERVRTMEAVAASEEVLTVFRAPDAVDTAKVAQVLEKLAVPADSGLPIGVWTADRQPHPALLPASLPVRRVPPPDFPDEGGYGSLQEMEGRTYFWVAAVVRDRSNPAGYVVQLRRVGNPNTAQQIEELVGRDASIFFADTAGGPWTALNGAVVQPPILAVAPGPVEYEGVDGHQYLSHVAAIGGTPWLIIIEQPLHAILAGPQRFLRRVSLAFLLALGVGALGVWIISRSFTRPVAELSRAAEAIAAGDYGRRVHLDRSDELGGLAAAFNGMSEQVQVAHADLRHQFLEARTLAEELERANARLHALMAETEAARESAEQANRAKSDFLATMSHEVRTPINAVVGYTDLLLLGVSGPVSDGQREHLERVRASGQHLIRLVDEVLDLARIESGRLHVEENVGEVEAAVSAALSLLRPDAVRKGVRLEWDPEAGSGLRYRGDSNRVEQVLVNLIANAVKFTPTGGRIVVRCSSTAADPSGNGGAPDVLITVEDTGIGIPEEQIDRIFEPFVQGDAGYTRRHGGAGLGLAISRQLARAMGGDLTASSRPGEGSSFTLRLPPAEQGEPRRAGPAERKESPARDGSGPDVAADAPRPDPSSIVRTGVRT